MNWVDFQNTDWIKSKLETLDNTTKPKFGKMNAQQMIEHLSFIFKLTTRKNQNNFKVPKEIEAKTKPFLDSDKEIQPGFKPPLMPENPIPVKFDSIQQAINDLLLQIELFEEFFAKNRNIEITHPVFGKLNYSYWKKFHIKHFTHHFKQFNLL